MKTINFLKYLVFVLVLSFGISSCEGDEGPPGPAGINGTHGTDGTNGTNGDDGTDGIDGTNGTDGADGTNGTDGADGSKTYYSNWLTPTWIAESNGNVKIRYAKFNANSLSQSIVDRGIVLVYLKMTDGRVFQLPISSGGIIFQVIFSLREIIVNYSLADSPYVTPPVMLSSNKIRYILVPGTNLASKASQSKQDDLPDVSNYYEVCDYYGINP